MPRQNVRRRLDLVTRALDLLCPKAPEPHWLGKYIGTSKVQLQLHPIRVTDPILARKGSAPILTCVLAYGAEQLDGDRMGRGGNWLRLWPKMAPDGSNAVLDRLDWKPYRQGTERAITDGERNR
jgi:hypothetical protein